jgi:peroxiredoxin
VWSHRAWAETLGLEGAVTLLSDWAGEATIAFGVERAVSGMGGVPQRSAFLVEGGTVRAAWLLGREMPDIDAIVGSAMPSSSSS